MEQQASFNKDPELWELAKKRVGFKSHLITYLLMIPFFWLIWFLAGSHVGRSGLPWAVWPTAGWGVGVLFHFLGVYVFSKYSLVEGEYENLVRNKN